MLRRLILALALLAGPAWAIGVDAPLADPEQEARARAIARELRCLVCQNQSIEDSNADLARDLRHIVRERIAAGDSDATVKQFLVQRYGEWVLLKPPFNTANALLWLAPALVLAAGAAFVLLRRRRAAPATPPLSASEQAELDRALGR